MTLVKRLLLLVLAVSALPGCRKCLQEKVQSDGFVPLAELDLIQIVIPGEAPRSEDILIGTVIPWNDLKKSADCDARVLHFVMNPFRPPFRYKVDLAKGPQEILDAANTSLDVNLLKLGSWAKIGLSGHATARIKLNNVWHGNIQMTEAQRVAFFAAAEPTPFLGEDAAFLWITEFVAADVDNLNDLGLNAGVEFKRVEPQEVKLVSGSTQSLKGPGLLLGIRGYVGTARSRGTIEKQAIPKVGAASEIKIAISESAEPLTLRVARTQPNEVRTYVINLPDARVWTKDREGRWKPDAAVGDACVMKLDAPNTKMLELGEDTVRMVVVKGNITGDRWMVLSLVVTQEGDGYALRGSVFNLSLKPLP